MPLACELAIGTLDFFLVRILLYPQNFVEISLSVGDQGCTPPWLLLETRSYMALQVRAAEGPKPSRSATRNNDRLDKVNQSNDSTALEVA